MSASNAVHGTTLSISPKNRSRRVGFFFDSKLREAKERCFIDWDFLGDCWL
jgi:hypothetical protein